MMDGSARTVLHDLTRASRKAEEAALRRYQAASWIENLVGPLSVSRQPSEREFISCLRNGLILCNVINKIQPGAVPKVVEINSHVQSLTRDFQPLPAYQYFENVRNFLVAVEELKVPAFEASDLERDNLEAGSGAKVVDCILALKAYHEWKQANGGNGFYKHVRSPIVMHSAGKDYSRPSPASCRRLDVSVLGDKQVPVDGETQKLEKGSILKVLAEYMVGVKENIDQNLLVSIQNGNMDSLEILNKIISNFLEEQLQNKFPECCRTCLRKGNCNHRHAFRMQEKKLMDLKALLSRTKREFKDLQCQLHRDLKELEYQVLEMSAAANGYHKVVEENRNLYNMVQDLKGNIRVYCRVRPAFNAETKNVIDFVGRDGSLVILDPLKPQKEGRKIFQFNRVFGPTATQDDVFRDTQPLIRSVMDGYNVCIFAYGQTGTGKTYTMSGPSSGSTKDTGINYLALNYLFQTSHRRKDIISYDIRVQMIEIYNEQVRDLLAEDSSNTKLEIRSCTNENGLSLPDATMHSVKSSTDVLNLMKLGEVNRVVSCTALNDRSSRSHSVLTVHVHGKDTYGSTLRSCLHLVDLAGSERVDKSEVTGERLREAQYINKSLSCLGDVITALAQKNSHIPYRNSKLTLLLQDSLGGNAKTLMFAHVSPEGDSFGETYSTLKFAQRVSTVELGSARLNKESSEVIQLKEQIESLKKAIATKEEQSVLHNKLKQPRLCDRPKAMTDLTPPRARRLSIENGGTMKSEKAMHTDDRKELKTSSVPTRSRRLSLEGPKYRKKDNMQTDSSDVVTTSLPFETVSGQKGQYQDAEAVSKMDGSFRNSSSMMEVHFPRVSRSPTSSSFQKRAIKIDNRTQIPSLQLPKTPEPQISATNELHIVMQSELTVATDSQITNGKGSHIRKSLRTIGKLINGSEKRNQQASKEARSPIRVATSNNASNLKSPVTANARAVRRQSLTGIQTLGSDRRTSLGGKLFDSRVNDNRNAKTPPPVRSSIKTKQRRII